MYGCGEQEAGVASVHVYRFPHTTYPYSSCICSFFQHHPYFLLIKKMFFLSISRDEQDAPLTQYITNAGISRARYTIIHFKHHHLVVQLISNLMSV